VPERSALGGSLDAANEVRRVPSPNRYIAVAKFCFCKNNKRLID
jgi:hypothetical protein